MSRGEANGSEGSGIEEFYSRYIAPNSILIGVIIGLTLTRLIKNPFLKNPIDVDVKKLLANNNITQENAIIDFAHDNRVQNLNKKGKKFKKLLFPK